MYLFAIVDDTSEFAATEKLMYVTDEEKFNEQGCLWDGYPEYGEMLKIMNPLQEHGIYESMECMYELTCSEEEAERLLLATGNFKKTEAFTEYAEGLEIEE